MRPGIDTSVDELEVGFRGTVAIPSLKARPMPRGDPGAPSARPARPVVAAPRQRPQKQLEQFATPGHRAARNGEAVEVF